MQPRILRSLVLLLALNILVKPLWLLGIEREVQNLNGSEAYGLYYALFNLSLYLQILLDPGLHTWNNKTIAQNRESLSEMLSKLLPLKVVLAAVYLAATCVLGLTLGFGGQAIKMLILIGIVQVLQSFLLYMRTCISGLQHFNADSVFSVLDRGLMIVVCGAIIWTTWFGRQLSLLDFIYAQLAVSLIALSAAAYLVFRETKFFSPTIQFSSFISVFRSSWPFALLGLLMTLYSRIDIIMLERIHPDGAYEAGIYASAYRLLEAANMIAFLFAGILMPLLSNMLSRNESVMPTANLFFRFLMVPGLLLVLGCSIYKEPIMYLLYNEATPYSAQVFSYLIPSFLAWGTVYIYGSLLTARGNLKYLNISSAIGLAANIALNIFLIPKYGAKGAAGSALITQGIVALSQYVRAHLIYPFSVPPADTLRWAAFVFVSVCSFMLFANKFADWKTGFILLTASNLIFAAAIGLLKPRYFIKLLKFEPSVTDPQRPAESEFNFTAILDFLLRYKWPILIVSLAAGILGAIFSAPTFIPPKYESTVILYPATSASIGDIMNYNQGEKQSIMAFGEEEEADQLLQILESDEITNRIVQKYDLMKHYDIDPQGNYPYTKLMKKFQSNVTYRRTEYMSVEISVLDTDPKKAADMANDIAALVDSAKNKIQRQRALDAYNIVKNEYESKQAFIRNMVDSLQKLGALGVYNVEEQANALSTAYANALSSGNSSRIAAIEKQREILGRYGPVQKSISDRILYDTEEISRLRTKYEQAKVNAEQFLPATFVVNKASPGEKKIYPVRWLIVVISILSAFVLSVLYFILLDNYRQYHQTKQHAAVRERALAEA